MLEEDVLDFIFHTKLKEERARFQMACRYTDRGGLAVVPLLLDLFFAFLSASLIPFAFGIERPTR